MQAIHPGYAMQVRIPSARRPSPSVYRRRRLAVLFCAVALLFFVWVGLRQLAGASSDGPLTVAGRSAGTAQLVARTQAVVQPGDTLWSIARRFQPSGDVRPLVAALESQRSGRALQAGERIDIPLGP